MQTGSMEIWASGYTRIELEDAQERYGLQFPPDLLAMLSERRPAGGYRWEVEDPHIRTMLAWPMDALLFDVANGFWWPAWGERPLDAVESREVVVSAVRAAPKLIPLFSHRFLPEAPMQTGNPVFSMHGFDTIYYGSNLENYFDREFGEQRKAPVGEILTRVPFWSDLVEGFDKAYSHYAATGAPEALISSIQANLRDVR